MEQGVAMLSSAFHSDKAIKNGVVQVKKVVPQMG